MEQRKGKERHGSEKQAQNGHKRETILPRVQRYKTITRFQYTQKAMTKSNPRGEASKDTVLLVYMGQI